jgi:DNA-binding XRE family transcriptional regulator
MYIISILLIGQVQNAPLSGPAEIGPYTAGVPRRPHPKRGPRPEQGAHLLELRKAAGLTQTELAEAVGVPQANIVFWEWSDKPPRSDLLPKMAKVLAVRVDDLIVTDGHIPLTKRPGPVGEIQRAFEAVRQLPRSQQRKIVETVDALVDQYRRKEAG